MYLLTLPRMRNETKRQRAELAEVAKFAVRPGNAARNLRDVVESITRNTAGVSKRRANLARFAVEMAKATRSTTERDHKMALLALALEAAKGAVTGVRAMQRVQEACQIILDARAWGMLPSDVADESAELVISATRWCWSRGR